MAVFPTPGSPTSTGLFFVLRTRMRTMRSISFCLPITGSSLPDFARAVRSREKLSSVGVRTGYDAGLTLGFSEPEVLRKPWCFDCLSLGIKYDWQPFAEIYSTPALKPEGRVKVVWTTILSISTSTAFWPRKVWTLESFSRIAAKIRCSVPRKSLPMALASSAARFTIVFVRLEEGTSPWIRIPGMRGMAFSRARLNSAMSILRKSRALQAVQVPSLRIAITICSGRSWSELKLRASSWASVDSIRCTRGVRSLNIRSLFHLYKLEHGLSAPGYMNQVRAYPKFRRLAAYLQYPGFRSRFLPRRPAPPRHAQTSPGEPRAHSAQIWRIPRA